MIVCGCSVINSEKIGAQKECAVVVDRVESVWLKRKPQKGQQVVKFSGDIVSENQSRRVREVVGREGGGVE